MNWVSVSGSEEHVAFKREAGAEVHHTDVAVAAVVAGFQGASRGRCLGADPPTLHGSDVGQHSRILENDRVWLRKLAQKDLVPSVSVPLGSVLTPGEVWVVALHGMTWCVFFLFFFLQKSSLSDKDHAEH